MSTLKQIIRLHLQGRGIKEIVRITSTARNTVRKYVALYKNLGIPVEELLAIEDLALEQLICPTGNQPPAERFNLLQSQLEPYMNELERVGVNRFNLWTEYIQKYPGGYSYSQFCHYILQYQKLQKTSMIMEHKPGDLLFVDFAGHPMEYVDVSTGEVIQVQIFLACLGYSQFSYAEAVPSQKSEDFISALNNALIYLGGVPQGIVPDNLKAAVTKADRYEPEVNKTLEDWANHNSTTIIPARSRHPQDKSLVENLVKQTYSRIYAPLRNHRFTSLGELNTAIRDRLLLHNKEKFRKKDYSRQDLFLSKEKQLLTSLPNEAFKIKKYRTLTLQKNSHIYLSEDKHYYSAPHTYIGQQVEAVYTSATVSIYAKGKLIAQHIRDVKPHSYTTVSTHLPSHYQQYKDRSPDYYLQRASRISPQAENVIRRLLGARKHPEVLYKSCDGILSLAFKTSTDEFNNACQLALDVDACNYSFIRNVLSNGTAKNYQPLADLFNQPPIPPHENVRGKNYYQ